MGKVLDYCPFLGRMATKGRKDNPGKWKIIMIECIECPKCSSLFDFEGEGSAVCPCCCLPILRQHCFSQESRQAKSRQKTTENEKRQMMELKESGINDPLMMEWCS